MSANRRAKYGLTLLEAIVALVIIGSGFAAVMELQGQLVRSLQTVERAHARAMWRLNAVEVAASLEQEDDRTGVIAWPDGSRLEWRPSDAQPRIERPNRMGMRQSGAWRIGLAPVAFTATVNGQAILTQDVLAVTATAPPPPPEEPEQSPF